MWKFAFRRAYHATCASFEFGIGNFATCLLWFRQKLCIRLKSWNRINVSTLIGLTNSLTRKTFLSVLAFWYSWLLGKADSFYFSDWMVLRLRVIELDNETCKWKWGSAVSDNIMTVHKRKSERSVISAYRLSTMLLPSALKFSLYFIIAAFEADLNIQAHHSWKIILDHYNRQFVGKTDAILFSVKRNLAVKFNALNIRLNCSIAYRNLFTSKSIFLLLLFPSPYFYLD